MRVLFALLIVLTPIVFYAQSLERQVIGASGGYVETANLKVSSTVGEAVTASASTASITLTQGFQQADPVSIGIEEIEFGLSVTAFPNPATDAIVLDISAEKQLELNIGLYEISGRELSMEKELKAIGKLRHTISLTSMAVGQYFIRLTNNDGSLNRTIIIEKTY